MTTEPEPNGYELMRGLKDLRESVDKLGAGMLTQTMFAMYQASASKEIQDAKDTGQEAKRDAESVRKQLEAANKQRAQMWFGIGVSLLGTMGAIVAAVVAANLGGAI